MRVFHIYADGKTVKEISWQKYRELSERKLRERKFVLVWKHELAIHHHRTSQYIRRKQLEQVLKECSNV